MKKLITIFLLLPFFVNAQQLINQKDPFTGKEVKGAVVLFGSLLIPTGQTLGFAIDKEQKYIAYSWTSPSGTFGAFNEAKIEETSIMIKLVSDSILIFKANPVLSKILNSGSQSTIAILSLITNEQLKVLSEQTIKILRIGFKDEAGVDIDGILFTKKNKEQVKKAAAFML